MVVDVDHRVLYVVNPGTGRMSRVRTDSGTFARKAREEYPIFSNRLTSFEYSLWECVEHDVLVKGLTVPSGAALSDDGRRIFVNEHETGKIYVFETKTGALLTFVETGSTGTGGMAFSPTTGRLHYVDSNDEALYVVLPTSDCGATAATSTTTDYY